MVSVPLDFFGVVGCRSCVWKFHGLCPKGLVGGMVLPDSLICGDFSDFLSSLAGDCSSVVEFKERFFLYCSELDVLGDRVSLAKLVGDRDELLGGRSKGDLSADELKKINFFDSDILAAKLWLSRLNESLIKGLSKVADRESRERIASNRTDGGGDSRVLSIQAFSKMLNSASNEDNDGGT